MKKSRLSVIIAAHNEEGRIAKTLEEYAGYFYREYGQDFEIIVIPNGCTDQTLEILNVFRDKFPQTKVKTFQRKIGKGGAIIEGLKLADGDTLLLVDADGATPPTELDKLITELSDNDGAVGSRWLPQSRIVKKQSSARRFASRGFNLLIRALFGLPFADTQCGAKAFRKQAIDGVLDQLETTNFAFDVELLYELKRKGYRIKEVPITWEDIEGSTLNLKRTIPMMFLAVIRLRMLNSPFKFMINDCACNYILGRRR